MPQLPAPEMQISWDPEQPLCRWHPAPAEGETPSGLPPRHGGVSFSPYSPRLCAFALSCFSLLASFASAGYPPETERLLMRAHRRSPKKHRFPEPTIDLLPIARSGS